MLIGQKYYMDSTTHCSRGVIDLDNSYFTVTVEARRSKIFSYSDLTSCSITFKSSSGFEVDFDKGWIRSNGVVLTLHNGPNSTSPVLVSHLNHPARLCRRN